LGFAVRTQRRLALRSCARFIFHTDINRFYPSIYTHCIPWAIHGKAVVKAARAANTIKQLWADQLDIHARNINDQQTMGLPIGPDISLLLAEIVLGAVDTELACRLPDVRGIRIIDDYEFAAHQRSGAEKIAGELQAILSHYELALSPTKTQVVELPDVIEPLWTSRLRVFFFRDAGVAGQRNDLTAYFDAVFSLAKAEPRAGIIKYAIPRLNSVDIREENWRTFEHILAQCAMVEPACIPQVSEQLVHYRSVGRTPDVKKWQECLNIVVTERLPLGEASEALWSMWLMKTLGLSLSPGATRAVAYCDDSAAALMGLALAEAGLADPSLLRELDRYANAEDLNGRQWLLCYEGNRRGWIRPTQAKPLSGDPRFALLDSGGVSFFNPSAPATTPRRGGRGGGGGGDYSD